MTVPAPKWLRRIFHPPHGVPYPVGNSYFGLWLAHLLGYHWIDQDAHVTLDGVVVFGHWGKITLDGFILPPWFVAKYGHHPTIETTLWPDLARLRTRRIWYRGKWRRFQYRSAAQMFHTLLRFPTLGIAIEMKGSIAFYQPLTFTGIINTAHHIGLVPENRLVFMSLPTTGDPRRKFRAAKTGAPRVTTMIQCHDLPKPPKFDEWDQWVDYTRGRWAA